jgi:Na+/alanine symporter
MVSNFGKQLFRMEKFFKNIKIFISRNQKLVEISFLFIYAILQIIIALRVKDIIVTLMVIIVLTSLMIERIFVQIGTEYEKRNLQDKLDFMKKEYDEKSMEYFKELYKLKAKK